MKAAQSGYDRITTTIEREWLAQIIAGTKKIEYRRAGEYGLHIKKVLGIKHWDKRWRKLKR